ncbi:hypothetical protein [Streptomyces sp. JNUCC 63]
MSSPVVVAGASMASLRAAGHLGPITLVGDEPRTPCNRPPLSKEVLAGKASFESLAFRLRAAVADAEWRLGTGSSRPTSTDGSSNSTTASCCRTPDWSSPRI